MIKREREKERVTERKKVSARCWEDCFCIFELHGQGALIKGVFMCMCNKVFILTIDGSVDVMKFLFSIWMARCVCKQFSHVPAILIFFNFIFWLSSLCF